MKKYVALACLVGCVLWGATASGDYTVYGSGTMSCGRWTAETRRPSRLMDLSWVQGFVTAFGLVEPAIFEAAKRPYKPMRKTDAAAMEQWISQYCASHPLDDLFTATQALVTELHKK